MWNFIGVISEMRTRSEKSYAVVVEGKKFSRTLFRTNDGPDILVNQVVQSGRTFYYNLWSSGYTAQKGVLAVHYRKRVGTSKVG